MRPSPCAAPPGSLAGCGPPAAAARQFWARHRGALRRCRLARFHVVDHSGVVAAGRNAHDARGVSAVRPPTGLDVVSKWCDMAKVWSNMLFNELRVAPRAHPVLLMEMLMNLRAQREHMARFMVKMCVSVYPLMLRAPRVARLASPWSYANMNWTDGAQLWPDRARCLPTRVLSSVESTSEFGRRSSFVDPRTGWANLVQACSDAMLGSGASGRRSPSRPPLRPARRRHPCPAAPRVSAAASAHSVGTTRAQPAGKRPWRRSSRSGASVAGGPGCLASPTLAPAHGPPDVDRVMVGAARRAPGRAPARPHASRAPSTKPPGWPLGLFLGVFRGPLLPLRRPRPCTLWPDLLLRPSSARRDPTSGFDAHRNLHLGPIGRRRGRFLLDKNRNHK